MTLPKKALCIFTLLTLPALCATSTPSLAASKKDQVILRVSSIQPGLSSQVEDYVTRCTTAQPTIYARLFGRARLLLNGHSIRGGGKRTLSLRPNQRVVLSTQVRVRTKTKRGVRLRWKNNEYSIRCAPSNLPAYLASGKLPSSIPFLAISSNTIGTGSYPYAVVVDRNGTPVWWKKIPDGEQAADVKYLPGGKIGFWHGALTSDRAMGPFDIFGLDGKLQTRLLTSGEQGDQHETLPAKDGTFYRLITSIRPAVDFSSLGITPLHAAQDNQIQQLDSHSKLLWSWSSQDHILPEESGFWVNLLNSVFPQNPFDLVHFNSIEEDGKGGLIISSRHTDAIYRINRADGTISWKLGGTHTDKSLTILGDDSYAPYHLAGQHDARLLPDGTISVFDNGSGRGQQPRILRWRINTQNKTAQIVESFSDPQVTFSAAGGSARRMGDGSWVISWSNKPLIKAYNHLHQTIFTLQLLNHQPSYRAAPITNLQRSQLIRGMDQAAKGSH